MEGTVVAAAMGGAVVGLAGGALPLVAGLFLREYKKALMALSACVLAGALGGVHAAVPVSIGSLVGVVRARQDRRTVQGAPGLVFKYDRLSMVLAFVGIPVMTLVSFAAGGFAFIFAASDVGPAVKLAAVAGGLIGIGFGYAFALWARNWHVLLSEYTLTDDGVTVRRGSSTQFMSWGALVDARYRRALHQVDLEFNDFSRRVILTNVDTDPAQERILEAVALVERRTGRPVSRSWF